MVERTVTLSPDDQHLKVETARAIDAAGGQAKAAGYTRIGQQTISDCASLNVPRFIPLDAARDLDRVTHGAAGWPIILRAYANQIDCDVVPRPAALPTTGDWHAQLALASKETGDAMGPILEALADTRVCRKDVKTGNLIGEVDQVIQAWVTIRAMLKQAED